MPFAKKIDGDDVAPDHTMIMAHQKEVVTAEIATERTFPLLGLAPELRLLVYEPLIEAGDLSILRVSKLVSREALPLLSQVAILRLDLGRPMRSSVTPNLTASITSSGLLTPIAPDYIQNVNLRLNMTSCYGPRVDPRFIYSFSGNTITRKSCSITIFLGTFAAKPYGSDYEAYKAIAAMVGFKILLLKLERERNVNWEAYMFRIHEPGTAIKMIMGSRRILIEQDYKRVSAKLETTLGPADFNVEDYVRFLRFQPSQYKIETV